MIDWSKYRPDQIKTDVDDNGNRLLSAFAKDYKKLTGKDVCHTCPGFENRVKNFIKNYSIMSTEDKKEKKSNCEYVLKEKYEGIQLGFGGKSYSNKFLTNEMAEKLLKKHPAGKDLFEEMPEQTTKEEDPVDELKKLKKSELIETAKSLGIENLEGNKDDIIARIIDKQS